MQLTDSEKKFLVQRKRLITAWPYMAVALLCLVLALLVVLFLYAPMLANPFLVFEKIEDNSIPACNLKLMAAMLPIIVITTIFLVLFMVLFVFAAIGTEKKHLALIQRLLSGKAGQ